jgi:CheY-like chemotaxis protein
LRAEVLEESEGLIGEDIALVNKLDSPLGKVRADPGQIEQVILNLAVNSRDAMPLGGDLTIETRNANHATAVQFTQGEVRPGNYVMLVVSDTGCGMSQEVQGHIFEPFFTTKEAGKGTGLGLATVYGIVNQSGGYIAVESTLGEGATFRVFLPRVFEAMDSPGNRATSAPDSSGETVLLVEDEDSVRNLASAILNENGYRVLQAKDGEQALGIAREFPDAIHVLITDIVMPQVSGRQLAEAIKSLRPSIQVLYMSGYTDDIISHHGELDSGTAFLQKPFSAKAFINKIVELLARRDT